MTKRRRYTDEFRANAVLMLEAAGYPDKPGALAAAARRCGVPDRTLSRWYNKEQNPPPDLLVKHKKGELLDWIEEEIQAALKAAPDARPDASYKDLITGAAILIDKRQLLTGAPTENSSTRIIIRYADDNPDTP